VTGNNTVTPEELEPEEVESKLPVLKVTSTHFGALCGVHHNTVSTWVKDGLPVIRVGRRALVNLAVGFPWVRARDAAAVKEARAAGDPESAKGAKLQAEARLKEMDLAEREARLVAADDVEETWAHALVSVREAVMAVAGNAVQSGVILPAQESELEDLCREALTALGKQLGDDEEEAAG
jgi:phage terminase Nu1 subunit (DNA packaging protein)